MRTRKSRFVLSALGVLLLLPFGSVAAQTSPTVTGAITVVGEGSASVPAESATIVITIGGDPNIYVDPAQIEPAATPAATNVDATPIVEAIVADGISAENVQVVEPPFGGEWGPGMPAQPVTLLITMANPTVDDISALLQTVRTVARESTLFVNQFGVIYGVEDCASLRQQARANAVAAARVEADAQAAALDVTSGPVVASRDTSPMAMGAYQMNSCTSGAAMVKQAPMAYSAMPFDPSQPAEVTVWMAVEVSFQIP